MNMHEWAPLALAKHAEWSALAFAAAKNLGPPVVIEQCRICNALRVSWGETSTRVTRVYGSQGRLVLAEPECSVPRGTSATSLLK